MREIRRSNRFKKDYKNPKLSDEDVEVLKYVIKTIACGEKLDTKFRDHRLSGEWSGYRELHLKPDLLLIYKTTTSELRLARLGSHSNLFG